MPEYLRIILSAPRTRLFQTPNPTAPTATLSE